jgi:hypothetical protein
MDSRPPRLARQKDPSRPLYTPTIINTEIGDPGAKPVVGPTIGLEKM